MADALLWGSSVQITKEIHTILRSPHCGTGTFFGQVFSHSFDPLTVGDIDVEGGIVVGSIVVGSNVVGGFLVDGILVDGIVVGGTVVGGIVVGGAVATAVGTVGGSGTVEATERER